MSIDIDILKTFLEVNRTRHFGKAADNLFLTQSSVSARIKLLEEDVGNPVFTRKRNDIQLTPAGQKILRYAESIVNTWSHARQEVAIEDENTTPLAVAGMPSLWDIALQDWLHHCYKNCGNLMLSVDIAGADTMPRRLLDGTLDLAFMYDPPQFDELEHIKIITIPLELISSTRETSFESALTHNYVLVDWGTSFANSHARHFDDTPTPSMRTSHGRIAMNYILNCGGAAYLPRQMVQARLESGELYTFDDAPIINRVAYAVYPSRSNKIEEITNTLNYFSS